MISQRVYHIWMVGFIALLVWMPCASAGFFDYFLPNRNGAESTELKALPSVPYELTERDEKFIQEGAKLIGASLSQLDVCHHRVILTLKKSCGEMNAEQLGKLAVMLLNCQSDSEGRAMYQCTDSMTLKECTLAMDSDTWNAYHLITNRAKAICAAVRQEQFRGLTEMTVNKLMQTAHDQISIMNELAGTQEKLQMATQNSLNELADNNLRLIDQQQEMLKVSDEHRTSIETNLQDIMHEKNLIKAGQLEVAQMITALKLKLDDGMETLDGQSVQTRSNHADLMRDLAELHENAVKISEKLEDAMEYVLSQTQVASSQFDQTVKQLNEINKTVFDVADLIRHLQTELNGQLHWITEKVGGTDNFLAKLQASLQYLGYLLLGMLLLVFVSAPAFHRIVFLMAVVVTFGINVSDVYVIPIWKLTVAITTVFLGHFVQRFISWGMFFGSLKTAKVNEEESDEEPDESFRNNNNNSHKTPAVKRDVKYESRETHTTYRGATPLMERFIEDQNNRRSATPFSVSMEHYRSQCTAVTLKGEQCRLAAIPDGHFCRMHKIRNG